MLAPVSSIVLLLAVFAGGDPLPTPARAGAGPLQGRASAPAADDTTTRAQDREVRTATLVRDLESGDESKRNDAVEALVGKDQDARDLAPRVVPLLRSPDAGVRLAALRVLERKPCESSISRLKVMARRDEDSEVRRQAVHTLVFTAPDRATETLRCLALEETEVKVRRTAIVDLGNLGSDGREGAADALIEILEVCIRDKDEYLTPITVRALTLATGKNLRTNVEGWRHLVDDQKARRETGASGNTPESDDSD